MLAGWARLLTREIIHVLSNNSHKHLARDPAWHPCRRARPVEASGWSATAREFHRGERDRQFVLYWTQEGNRIWNDADELSAQNESGFDWLTGAFSAHRNQPTGRMVVLVGTDGTSPLARSETARFSTELAGELYTLCPWAAPDH